MIIAHRFIGGITSESKSVVREADGWYSTRSGGDCEVWRFLIVESAKRTNDNSPPIHRWDYVRKQIRSPRSGRLVQHPERRRRDAVAQVEFMTRSLPLPVL